MSRRSMELAKTGIEGFDEAFGGLYRGQMVMVTGNPGSGKTTFCAKFLYEGARRFREPGLYISTGESKEEFYAYMRGLGMDFESLEKEDLFRYVEMLTPTSEDALMNLSKELTRRALEIGARRIVIDSITPILALTPSIEARAVLHNALKAITRELGAIVLITGETPIGEERIEHGVEEFVVDGIIRLRLEVPEAGAPRRIMEVLKLRGRPISRAFYDFEIGPPAGIRIYLSGVLEELESKIDLADRISTGIEGLDRLLGGGIIRSTATAVIGPPGSGKTLLLLTLAAENAARGEAVAFVTFEEPRQQIHSTLEFLGYDPGDLVERGLRILSVNPRAMSIRAFYDVVQKFAEMGGEECSILIIDGLNTVRREFGVGFHRVVRDTVLQAKKAGITTFLSLLKQPDARGEEATHLSTLVDNIIELRIREEEGRMRREVVVVKARMSEVPGRIFELRLERGKLEVG